MEAARCGAYVPAMSDERSSAGQGTIFWPSAAFKRDREIDLGGGSGGADIHSFTRRDRPLCLSDAHALLRTREIVATLIAQGPASSCASQSNRF